MWRVFKVNKAIRRGSLFFGGDRNIFEKKKQEGEKRLSGSFCILEFKYYLVHTMGRIFKK